MGPKNKILFVDHDCGYSGATVSLAYLIKAFINDHFDVYLLTPKTNEFTKDFVELGVKIIKCGNRCISTFQLDLHFTAEINFLSLLGFGVILKNIGKVLYGFFMTLKVLISIKPDILYLNEYVVIQSAFAGWIFKIPTVTHVRSQIVAGTFGFRNYLTRKSIIAFNKKIIAITKQEAIQLKTSSKKIKIMGEFLSDENYCLNNNIRGIKNELDIPPDGKIILFMGGISSIKGSLDIIRATGLLLDKMPNLYLLIIGDIDTSSAEKKKYYEECLGLCGTSLNYRILGHVANTIDFIRIADVLVSANNFSHFSRPIIEAWAQKKCVISYDLPHAKDLIEHEVNGLLVEYGNYAKLSDAIQTIFNDELLKAKLAENGYKKAIKEFNAKSNAKFIVGICKDLLK